MRQTRCGEPPGIPSSHESNVANGLQGRMAEWSKALESGCYGNQSSPKGRGFEPHFCQHDFLFLAVVVGGSIFYMTTGPEWHFKSLFKSGSHDQTPLICCDSESRAGKQWAKGYAYLYRSRFHVRGARRSWSSSSVLVVKPKGSRCKPSGPCADRK